MVTDRHVTDLVDSNLTSLFFPWAQWSLVVDMMQLELQKNIWLELVDVTSKFFRWAQCAQWSLVMDMMQLELKKKIIWW